MPDSTKARAIGFNHVALEVGDIEEALAFYGRLFTFGLRSKSDVDAFIDLGDQFIALQKGRTQPADDGRHLGLVVEASKSCRARSWTSAIPGGIASKSSAIRTFSSRRLPTCCVA
jgi:catechol 2,3-dioxygenase-like lactoylglutathione lyase family enzyme